MVQTAYRGASGRSRVENMILGQARSQIRDEYHGYMSLLKYWRDAAAHGGLAGINDNEAYTSLNLLLRLALFADQKWDELVSP